MAFLHPLTLLLRRSFLIITTREQLNARHPSKAFRAVSHAIIVVPFCALPENAGSVVAAHRTDVEQAGYRV